MNPRAARRFVAYYRATVKVIGGPVYKAHEIERLSARACSAIFDS